MTTHSLYLGFTNFPLMSGSEPPFKLQRIKFVTTIDPQTSSSVLTVLTFLHYFHQVSTVQIDLIFRRLDEVGHHSVGFQDDGTRNL